MKNCWIFPRWQERKFDFPIPNLTSPQVAQTQLGSRHLTKLHPTGYKTPATVQSICLQGSELVCNSLYYLKLVNYFYSFRLDTHIHLDFLYLSIYNLNHYETLLYKKCVLLNFESHQFIMGYLIMADFNYLATKLFVVFETFIILFTNNV